MLTLLSKLRRDRPQRLQEHIRRDRLGRLVHPVEQRPQLRGQPCIPCRAGSRVGSVGGQGGLQFRNGAEGLEGGVHVTGIAEVGQTGGLFELIGKGVQDCQSFESLDVKRKVNKDSRR
jgi:hypothetical protein